MDTHALIQPLVAKNNTKIVMYVADGLGGLPQQPGGKTDSRRPTRRTSTSWPAMGCAG